MPGQLVIDYTLPAHKPEGRLPSATSVYFQFFSSSFAPPPCKKCHKKVTIITQQHNWLPRLILKKVGLKFLVAFLLLEKKQIENRNGCEPKKSSISLMCFEEIYSRPLVPKNRNFWKSPRIARAHAHADPFGDQIGSNGAIIIIKNEQ